MRKLLFMAFAVLMLCGCGDSNSLGYDDGTRKPNEEVDGGSSTVASHHFITEYIAPNGIEVHSNAPGHLYLKVIGDVYQTFRGKDYEHYDKAEYLSDLYGDISYPGKVQPGEHAALAYPIEKISLWCGKDFDAEHPVGTPLDDIVSLYFETYYDFVQSGYKDYKEDNPEWVDPTLEEYLLSFEKVNADITKLTQVSISQNAFANVRFNSVPTELGEYPFTVVMTVNGEELRYSFNFTFE